MTFELWRRWLLVVGVAIALFGAAMALLSTTPLFTLAPIDSAFWGSTGPDPASRDFQAWAYAVWGATMAGWGLTVAAIAVRPFAEREPWAWTTLLLGTALWFVLDTGVSAAHGVMVNVVVNCALLIAIAGPLLATRSAFMRR